MTEQYSEMSKKLQQFINNQKIFFAGTAAVGGRVNIPAKGMDSLRVLNGNRVAWLIVQDAT